LPAAKASAFERAARQLGFVQTRQRGSHSRWKHPDGRALTIPVHPSQDIGSGLYFDLLKQLGVSEREFKELQ
jgi:predicted RNA binding protein YcfA (HicA-like mRNA interferase family)